jgi:hypothetical protein
MALHGTRPTFVHVVLALCTLSVVVCALECPAAADAENIFSVEAVKAAGEAYRYRYEPHNDFRWACFSAGNATTKRDSSIESIATTAMTAIPLAAPSARRDRAGSYFRRHRRSDPTHTAFEPYVGVFGAFARGHLIADCYFVSEPFARATYYTANVVPMNADCNTGTWSHRVERHVRRFIRRPENNGSIVLVGARGNAGSNGEGFIRPKQLWALVCPRRVGDEGTTPSLTPPVYFYAEVDPTARGCGCGVDALFGAGGACGDVDPPLDVRAAAASCFAQAHLTRLPWSQLVAMEQQHEQRRQGPFATPGV